MSMPTDPLGLRALLTAAALLLGGLVLAQDDQAALLRAALDQLDAATFADEVGEAYEELHARAFRLGDQQLTADALERLAARMVALSDDDGLLAARLDGLGLRARAVGDLPGARRLARRGLELREALHGPVHLDVSTSANHLAIAVELLGELEAALELYDRAVEIRTTLGEDQSLAASALLNNRAIALYKLSRYDDSLASFQRSLAIKQRQLAPDDPKLASTLDNMGGLLQLMGRPHEARPLHERALAILEAAYGADNVALTAPLANLSELLTSLGDPAAALQLTERALGLAERQYGPDDQRLAVHLEHLAQLQMQLGDTDAALQSGRRALRVQERSLPPVHPALARTLELLGNVHYVGGRLEQARDFYQRALEIEEQVVEGPHRGLLTALTGLAGATQRLGDLDGALALEQRVAQTAEQLFGPEHVLVGYGLMGMAYVHWLQGDLPVARQLTEQAYGLLARLQGPDSPGATDLMRSLVAQALDAADLSAARDWARRLGERQERLPSLLAGLTEAEALAMLQSARGDVAHQLSAHERLGDTDAVYAVVLRSKGRLARLAYRVQASDPARLDAHTRELGERLRALQSEVARRSLARADEGVAASAGESAAAELEALLAERDSVDRELRRLVEVDHRSVTPDAVRAALPADGALIDLLVESRWVPRHVGPDGVPVRGDWSPLQVDAWVLRPGDEQVRQVPLGELAPLQAALDEHLTRLVGDGALRGRSAGRPTRERPSQGALERLLWQPLAPLLDGVSTLFVSPDGPLGTLPFETLRDGDGRFLIESRGFVYLADAGTLLAERSTPSAAASDLLVVGDVDYAAGATAAATPGAEPGWAPLPATAAELESLLALHAQARPDAARLALRGAAASERNLLEQLPRHGLVHLATHGFFDGAAAGLALPEQLAGSASPSAEAGLVGARQQVLEALPGLRSGVVLAGVDGVPPDGGDGLLTAAEVAVADLGQVRLVVLSACETGLGKATTGEGLLGLRRAFHLAGAETVVSSLWSVPDDSTARLMAAFYEHLLVDGLGRQEALRQAQLALLAERRATYGSDDPHAWGAFVLSGAWR